MVDGVARGGGNEFVMTCDLAFGTENAAFAQPEIFINIQTGDQSGVTPGRKIGQPSPENAKNLTLRSNATFTAFTKHKRRTRIMGHCTLITQISSRTSYRIDTHIRHSALFTNFLIIDTAPRK